VHNEHMSRSWLRWRGRVAAGFGLWLVGACSVGCAQTRVKLESSGKPDALTQQVLRLGQDATRAAAMLALIEAGRPAVPLLLKVVTEEGALSMPALRTLAEMGAVARPAVPVLQGLGKNKTLLGDAARRTVAAIGERDSVVFADWTQGCIVELDAAGAKLREVKVDRPWCVQMVEDDHLLVCCFNDDLVREIDWSGKEIASWKGEGPIWVRRQIDGSMWLSEHNGRRVQHRAADGTVIAELKVHVRAFEVALNDNLWLLLDEGKLREVTATGDAVREYAIDKQPLALSVSPTGPMQVLYGGGLVTLDAQGDAGAVNKREGASGMSFVRMADGTQFFGDSGGISRHDASGRVVWRAACGLAACIVPRIEPVDGH
jgi:hypothetical protein